MAFGKQLRHSRLPWSGLNPGTQLGIGNSNLRQLTLLPGSCSVLCPLVPATRVSAATPPAIIAVMMTVMMMMMALFPQKAETEHPTNQSMHKGTLHANTDKKLESNYLERKDASLATA